MHYLYCFDSILLDMRYKQSHFCRFHLLYTYLLRIAHKLLRNAQLRTTGTYFVRLASLLFYQFHNFCIDLIWEFLKKNLLGILYITLDPLRFDIVPVYILNRLLRSLDLRGNLRDNFYKQ